MEAIIRTENKTLFEALLQFLQALNISVEINEPTRPATKTKKNAALT